MANSVSQVLLTEQPLEGAGEDGPSRTGICRHSAEDAGPTAGAVVDFWGVVRQLEDGREIEGIDYEANESMAKHQMQLIADGAVKKFQLKGVLLHHRIGFVRAGEASLFVRVTTQHRASAFEASKWMVDELKKKVPIWKKPKFRNDKEPAAETHSTSLRAGSAATTAVR
jgi:molybdopterin synthase catalytic subunit